jgi:hypothetical protein
MTDYTDIATMAVSNDEAQAVQYWRDLPNELKEVRRVMQDIKKLGPSLQSYQDQVGALQDQIDKLNHSEGLSELIARHIEAYLAAMPHLTSADLDTKLHTMSDNLIAVIMQAIGSLAQNIAKIQMRLDEDHASIPKVLELLNGALDTKLAPVVHKQDELLALVKKLPSPGPATEPNPGNGTDPEPENETDPEQITSVAELIASADAVGTSTIAVFDAFLSHLQAAKTFLSKLVHVPAADAQRLTARWETISAAMSQLARTATSSQRPALAIKAITIHGTQGEVARLLQQRVI